MLKVEGVLSCPVRMQRGIRQGCPLSGQLCSFTEKLRSNMQGLIMCGLQEKVVLSAYADDVMVFITKQENVQVLIYNLVLYQRASSTRVNWGKCESFIV